MTSSDYPRIRSFRPRRGRLTDVQRDALARLEQIFGAPAAGPLGPAELFGSPDPFILEIGCGMGHATIAQALADRSTNILAVDVHTPGIAQILRRIEQNGLTNLRVCRADALDLLEDRIPDRALRGVRVFFPDPWPKRRQRHRRLIDAQFAVLVASRLVPGGFVHVATDWAEYADDVTKVFEASPALTLTHRNSDPRPDRPLTSYEHKALAAGRPIADLIAIRLPADC